MGMFMRLLVHQLRPWSPRLPRAGAGAWLESEQQQRQVRSAGCVPPEVLTCTLAWAAEAMTTRALFDHWFATSLRM